MSRRARLVLALPALALLGALMVGAVTGLPDFGHPRGPYADLAPRIMLAERHVANAVTGVNFDLRGFDTLGEEFILFAAVLGAAVLLRAQRSERRIRWAAEQDERRATESRRRCARSASCWSGRRCCSASTSSPTGTHPGRRLPGRRDRWPTRPAARLPRRAIRGAASACARSRSSRSAKAGGRAGFVLIGLGGLSWPAPFLENFLPLGEPGELLSGRHGPAAQRSRSGSRSPAASCCCSRSSSTSCSSSARGRTRRAVSLLPYARRRLALLVGLYGVVTSRHLVHLIVCLASCSPRPTCCCSPIGYRDDGGAPDLHRHPAATRRPSTPSCRR